MLPAFYTLKYGEVHSNVNISDELTISVSALLTWLFELTRPQSSLTRSRSGQIKEVIPSRLGGWKNLLATILDKIIGTFRPSLPPISMIPRWSARY